MQIDLPIEIFTYPEIPLPEVWTVEQKFDTPALTPDQITAATKQAVEELAKDARLKPGANVAVGVGSRGLDNLVLVVRTAVAELKARDLKPFIVPAMGSHGGATAEGQASVLHDYGITPENVGAEIHATMEADVIGHLVGEDAGPYTGYPVYYDRNARNADAVLVINRIKPHTDFAGELESGVGKMCAIGLGKQRGAASIHTYGARGLREIMPRIARYMARHTNIVGGIALLENELGHTSEIHSVPAAQMGREGEKALLKRARSMSPRLPFQAFDILIVDEMGKNISGTGMDTHVIGRARMPSLSESEWDGPDIRIVAVLDLTQPSHGNAAGLGLADITTRRLIEKVDWEATFMNTRTSGEGGLLKSGVPLILPTSDDCVKTALGASGHGDRSQARLVRIRNTADTQFLEISGALLDEARRNPSLRISEASHTLDLCRPVRA